MLPHHALAIALATSLLGPQGDLPRRGALGLSFGPVPQETASRFKLSPGQGLVAGKPVPGQTADGLGVMTGDVLLRFNGQPVAGATIGAAVRATPSGSPITLEVLRGGKPMKLSGNMVERPRDPGNRNYTVEYSHVVSHGKRMRTIITRPKEDGQHPAFFFIQGFSPVSYDFTLAGSDGSVQQLDGPLLFQFADNGFVTMRVEKPGVGDSEGGPFADMDFTTELDIYRQALAQLKAQAATDAQNVFVFGHSMGGAFGPMIASESPVKGIAVYGTAARTWHEYILDTVRYQGLLAGSGFEDTDEEVRLSSRVLALAFHEGMSAEAIKKSHPELSATTDGLFPGGMFNGKSLEFWRQLGQTNFPRYWAKAKTNVLSVRGGSDFVTYDSDHKLIADVANKAMPGSGRFVRLPDSDHLFHDWETEKASQQNFGKGKFTLAFSRLMMDWIRGVIAKG